MLQLVACVHEVGLAPYEYIFSRPQGVWCVYLLCVYLSNHTTHTTTADSCSYPSDVSVFFAGAPAGGARARGRARALRHKAAPLHALWGPRERRPQAGVDRSSVPIYIAIYLSLSIYLSICLSAPHELWGPCERRPQAGVNRSSVPIHLSIYP